MLKEQRGRIGDLYEDIYIEIVSIKRGTETIKKSPVRNEKYNKQSEK